MNKKIIGLFLFLVFCIPVLSVFEMGAFLAQGQPTEEICAVSEDVSNLHETEHPIASILFLLKPASIDITSHVLLSEHLYSRQEDDIQTPPPLG
jgi:hypothetical protein